MADLLNDDEIEERLGELEGWSARGRRDHEDLRPRRLRRLGRVRAPADRAGRGDGPPPRSRDLVERGQGLDHQPLGRRADRGRLRARRRRSTRSTERDAARTSASAPAMRSAPAGSTGPMAAEGDVACVVLAHGFGGVKEARLDAYAERFAAAGLRGARLRLPLPRRLRRRAAAADRHRPPARRLAGGGRLRAAARRRRPRTGSSPGAPRSPAGMWSSWRPPASALAAVIAQGPFMSGAAVAAVGRARRTTAGSAWPGLRDVIARAGSAAPHPIAVVGPPGTTAAMTSPDAEPGYLALFPPGYDWPNRFLPRGTMSLPLQRPYAKAKRVACPLLVQVDDRRRRHPAGAGAQGGRARRRAGELIEYPGGHFDIYVGEPFERAVTDQLEFLDAGPVGGADADRPRPRHAAELRQDGAGDRGRARALRARVVGRSSTPASTTTGRCRRSSSRSSACPSPTTCSASAPAATASRPRGCSSGSSRCCATSARTSSSSPATSTRPSPRRSARRGSGSRSATSSPGCAASTARCPRRSTGSSPTTSPSCSSCTRRRPRTTCAPRASTRRGFQFVGNTMIDTLVALEDRFRERGAAARGSGSSRARTCSSRCTARRSSTARCSARRSRRSSGSPARCRSSSRSTRAPGRCSARARRRRRCTLIDPVGYLDFLSLEADAAAVLTDSGGIQEETTYLGVPCFTLRDNTERPVTVRAGHQHAARPGAGADRRDPRAARGRPPAIAPQPPEKWDGHAAERVADVLADW